MRANHKSGQPKEVPETSEVKPSEGQSPRLSDEQLNRMWDKLQVGLAKATQAIKSQSGAKGNANRSPKPKE